MACQDTCTLSGIQKAKALQLALNADALDTSMVEQYTSTVHYTRPISTVAVLSLVANEIKPLPAVMSSPPPSVHGPGI